MERIDKAISLIYETGFLDAQANKATELRDRFVENELIVSVVGQFKRGKSSLINAILGDVVLPVGIVPITTAVTEIRNGDVFRAVIIFEDNSETEVDREDLPFYISEQQNKDNHRQVSLVKIWTSMEYFSNDVVLVDTPGVGSIHKHNTEAASIFIEKSDAVLFLLSVDSPVSETERDYLLHTRKYASKFYFAVNKTDIVDARGLSEFISYTTAILSETLEQNIELYPVSAKTGDGVSELIMKIADDIRLNHKEMLSTSVDIKLSGIVTEAKSKIELYLKASALPAEELLEKLSALRKKQHDLSALSDEVQVFVKHQTEKLVEKIADIFDSRVEDSQSLLQTKAKRHYDDLAQLPARTFEEKLRAAFESDLRETLLDLDVEGMTMLTEGYSSIVGSLNDKATEVESFLSNMLNEFFQVDYAVNIREFNVTERNDFYIRISHNMKLYSTAESITRIMPRDRANKRIFDRALTQMRERMLFVTKTICYLIIVTKCRRA